MLLSEFITKGVSALGSLYPGAEARQMVLMLCESLLGTRSYTHIVDPGYVIDRNRLPVLESSLKRLSEGEPLQYVTGKAQFCDRDFHVGPGVLIPRPETEILAREALDIAKRIARMRVPYGRNAVPVRILDLCCGSGCLSWTLALDVPGAKVTAVDISEEALSIAKSQPFNEAARNGRSSVPVFRKADILDMSGQSFSGEYDLIVSNPPYIMESERVQMRRNVLDYEPPIALFVPDEDPLVFYRAIAEWSVRYLAPDGKGLTEINEQLGPETLKLFRSCGFSECELVKDFYDKNRFVYYSK